MNTLSRILSLWFVLALLAPGTHAQDLSEAASLPEGITTTGDTTEVRALTEWAEEHHQSHPEEARHIAERALTLAHELDDLRGIAESSMILGNLASDLQKTEDYYTIAREAFERIGDEYGVAYSQSGMGIVHMYRGEYEQALSAYFGALQDFERLGNIRRQSLVLNNIGGLHISQGNIPEALVYFERAVTLAETLDDPAFLVPRLGNYGLALMNHRAYEHAELIFRRALALAEEQGDRQSTAPIFTNLGSLLNKQGLYEQALPFLFTAESLSKELGEDWILGAAYDELAKTYMGLGQYDRALHFAGESLALTREVGSAYDQMEVFLTLSRIYESAGNDRQAFAHYRQYAGLRDSLFTAERTEIIADMQVRYETEERQRTIERLEQENRIQTLQASRWRISMIAGVSGLLLMLGFLYYRYRVKQKASRLLEELDAAKSRFFANISHEFRTPLTVILGGSQDMLAGQFGEMSEQASGQLHAMLRNTRQLQRLINEVLDLNRLESGHLELRPAPGDLVRSLQDIVEANAPLAERNGIALTLACDAENCPRLYDEEKLEKIVGNLLSNALKFTPRDGFVRVGLLCKDQVEISVADNGPGLPEEAREKIFERFVQLDHGMLKGGTGIGLALARELAELHGGTITLESTSGEGSTFTVRLPLDRTTMATVRKEKTRQLPVIEPFEIGGDGHTEIPVPQLEESSENEEDRTTVLIIEDNDDVRAYVRRSLEGAYRILEAADGEGGLQQARESLPDLIVSDVMLPDIDGYGITRRLKVESATECIPVVMLTARATEDDHVAGYESGAEAYITKPFSPETLGAAIARLLEERRRLRRQLQTKVGETASQNNPPTLSDRIRAVVLENLHDEGFGPEELASALGMSLRTLQRHLKSKAGLSPSDFVRVLRLEQARYLLTNGAGSVSEVAYAVGYNSLVAFSRAYRTYYGVPPSSHIGREEHVSE